MKLGSPFPGIQVRGQTVDMEPDAYDKHQRSAGSSGDADYVGISSSESSEQLQLFNITGTERRYIL